MSKLTIVMYHYVRDLANSRYPGIKGMDYLLFKRQIEFFDQFFSVVTMEQVLEYIAGCGNSKFPENALLLTFDDGYIDHYTYVFPVLQAHHMQGSFFVPGKTFAEDALLDVNKVHFVLASAQEGELLRKLYDQMNYYRGQEFDFPSNEELFQTYGCPNRFDTAETVFIKRMLQTALPERLRGIISTNLFREFVGIEERKFARELYMNYDQICLIKKAGGYIGLHGYDHYWLGNLTDEQMSADIKKALEVLDGVIDRENWVMNYPYGSYNTDTINYIKSQGCRLGLTTEVRVADLDLDGVYELPRLDCNDFPPKSERYIEHLK